MSHLRPDKRGKVINFSNRMTSLTEMFNFSRVKVIHFLEPAGDRFTDCNLGKWVGARLGENILTTKAVTRVSCYRPNIIMRLVDKSMALVCPPVVFLYMIYPVARKLTAEQF